MILPRVNPLKTKSWEDLKNHFYKIKDSSISDLFVSDPDRYKNFSINFGDLLLDFSRNRNTRYF
jgi:glucose-6-phosphate isomerase